MKPAYLLTLPLLFSLFACERRPQESSTPEPLTGQPFATGDYLDSPSKMVAIDGRLVLLDRSAPMVHVFRLEDGRRIGSFGAKGDGPGEYRNPGEVQRDPHDPGAFWIFDGGLLRMTRLRFGHADSLPAVDSIVNLHAGTGVFFEPVWLTDTTLAVAGIFPGHPDGRLLLTRGDGEFIRGIGTAPRHPGAANIPTTVLQHAYEGPLAVHPARSRLALATRLADRLEIYRADGTLAKQVVGSTGFLPKFEVNERAEGVSMATGDDLRVGYVDLESTGELIFALFSGSARSEAGSRVYFGKEVHVFDWDGNLVSRLALGERAFTIAVDSGSGFLYATHHDPAPRVARYRLPSALHARARMAAR